MSNINDNKILELKKQIEKKKELIKLSKSNSYEFKTNRVVDFEGEKYNLNVLQADKLNILMIRLNMYKLAAIDLKILDQCIISGYNVQDWINDIRCKLEILNLKEEERKLKLMENKLDKMLSDEKKVELELNEIEDMLK
ncbi:TPA: hypothetical protein ACXDAZ_002574 [Clostridium botulinum]